MSVNQLSAKCLLPKCLSAKCLLAKCLWTKCLWTNCLLIKCLSTKCLFAKCLFAKCLFAKCLSAKCLSAKCLSAKCLSAKCFSTRRCGTFLTCKYGRGREISFVFKFFFGQKFWIKKKFEARSKKITIFRLRKNDLQGKCYKTFNDRNLRIFIS